MKREVTNKSLALHAVAWNNQFPKVLPTKTILMFWPFQTSFQLLAEKEHNLFVKGLSLNTVSAKTIYHHVPSLLFSLQSWLSPQFILVRSQTFTWSTSIIYFVWETWAQKSRRDIYERLQCPQGYVLIPWPKDNKARSGLTMFLCHSECSHFTHMTGYKFRALSLCLCLAAQTWKPGVYLNQSNFWKPAGPQEPVCWEMRHKNNLKPKQTCRELLSQQLWWGPWENSQLTHQTCLDFHPPFSYITNFVYTFCCQTTNPSYVHVFTA